MKRLGGGGLCALAVILAASAAASAATIQEVLAGPFNPATTDFYAAGYGQAWYALTWNNVGPGNLFLPGQPGPDFKHTPGPNPAWLDFHFVSNGGGGGGNGGGNQSTQTTYSLGNNNGGAWAMDFSVLLYDPDFSGTEIKVELVGSADGSDYAIKTLTPTQVQGGFMVKWHISAVAGENVLVRITSTGDESYAAGFFMDNPVVAPEPATMGLVAVGLAGWLVRRRR